MNSTKEMNFQPWQHRNSRSPDSANMDTNTPTTNTSNITSSGMDNSYSIKTVTTSTSSNSNSTTTTIPVINKSILQNQQEQQQQQQQRSFPSFTSRSLSQFNEDVSSAVLALVHVKTQPQHEQVHEQVQQKISKLTRPTTLQHQHSSPHSVSQRLQIRQQDELIQQIEAQRQFLLGSQQPIVLLQQQQQQQQVPSSLQNIQKSQFQEDPQPPEKSEKQPIPVDRNGKQLTNTKRAAQNRNAQKLFRLRREQYVKDLEAEVRDAKLLKNTVASLREENLQLRDYILTLQSKLLENDRNNNTSHLLTKEQHLQFSVSNNNNVGNGLGTADNNNINNNNNNENNKVINNVSRFDSNHYLQNLREQKDKVK